MIQVGDAGIIADLGLADQFRIDGPGFGIEDTPVFLKIFICFLRTDKRRAEILSAVQIKIMLRRVERRMGP